mmetsp:Transcript_52038/g.125585  ORF Transcript_52038/g.125585 Transcript_52038/m.125585 type:complete len:636 (-) Transcript_52038:69-1976(-)
MGDLRSSGDDDHVKVGSFLLGDVGTLEGTLTAGHVVHVVVLVDVLTREDQCSGSLLACDRGDHGCNSLFGVSRTVNIQVGDNTESRNCLNRLVSGAVLTDTDGVVREDVRDTVQLRKSGDTDSGAEVVDEDQEGRSRDLEKTVESESVHDGTHGVFTDTEVKVLSGVRLVEASTEVSTIVDVVTGRSVKIGRSRNVVRDELGDFLDDLVSRNTCGLGGVSHGRDGGSHFTGAHGLVLDSVLELLGKLGVGLLPCREGGLPRVVCGLVLLLDVTEEVTSSLRDIPLLTVGKADVLLGLVDVGDTSLTVSSVGTLGLLHTLSDDGVALDELGLSVVTGLGGSDGFLNGIKVMSVNFIDLPAVCFVPLQDVLGLCVLCHLVKGDLVGVVHNDQVVELLVGGEGSGLGGDTLLEATVTRKSKDVVVEDLVVVGVVDSGGHLLRGGHTDSVGDTLSEGTGCGLDSGSVVLGAGEFWVAGCHGVVLTEVLDFLHRQVESGKVEPRVQEHRPVSGRKDESVTVDPLGVLGVVLHLRSVKDGTDLGGTKGKTHVTGVCGGDRVHGQTTCLVGGCCKCRLCVSIDSSAHHECCGRVLHLELRCAEGIDTRSGKGHTGQSEGGELHGGIIGVVVWCKKGCGMKLQ